MKAILGELLPQTTQTHFQVKLELVMQSAYACSPKKHCWKTKLVLRSSLLFMDNDFIQSEGTRVIVFNYMFIFIFL